MDTLPKIPKEFTEDSWTHAIIRKGYVRRGYIAERTGLYPELRFVFSPMLPEQVDEMEHAVGLLRKPKDASAVIARTLAGKIKAWSLAEPINEASLRSMGHELLNRLRMIVCMRFATDTDPLWEDETNEFKTVDELLGESSEPSDSD
jgi:hypothetical protein